MNNRFRARLAFLLALMFVLSAALPGIEAEAKEGEIAALPDAAVGDYVEFGSYEQDGDEENGKEPIEWLVAKREGDRVMLVSRYILEAMPLSREAVQSPWAETGLREWLNGSFILAAFTPEEQFLLAVTPVSNAKDSKVRGGGEADTRDQVFLLSRSEANDIFKSPKNLQAFATPRCKDALDSKKGYDTSVWWTRTAGETRWKAACVGFDGSFALKGNPVTAVCGVRPAVWVNLSRLPDEDGNHAVTLSVGDEFRFSMDDGLGGVDRDNLIYLGSGEYKGSDSRTPEEGCRLVYARFASEGSWLDCSSPTYVEDFENYGWISNLRPGQCRICTFVFDIPENAKTAELSPDFFINYGIYGDHGIHYTLTALYEGKQESGIELKRKSPLEDATLLGKTLHWKDGMNITLLSVERSAKTDIPFSMPEINMPEIKGYHYILCRVRLEYTADDCHFGDEWGMSCCADGVFCEIADVPTDNELCEEQEDGTEILTFRCLVPNDAALLEINIPCRVCGENGATSLETVTLYSMLP